MFATEEAKPIKQPKGKSNSILWVEAVAFSLIIVLSWVTEAIRIPHLLYGEAFVPNWHRAVLRTVIIFLIWAWVHLSTRQLLKRLHHLEEFLRVCSWCHKVCHDGDWLEMERYLTSKFETKTTHGMCPHCLKKKVVEIAAKEPTTLTSSPERSRNTP
jgi:hypothetical protein